MASDGTGRPCGPPPAPRTFASFSEADTTVKNHALNNGYTLVVRNRYPAGNNATRYNYKCGKGRAFASQSTLGNSNSKRRKTSSQMTNCPFSMNIKRQPNGLWVSSVQKQDHNHDAMAAESFGYIRSQVLSQRRADAVTMWNSGIRPRDIVTSLANPQLPHVTPIQNVTRKDIINLLAKHRQEELAGRTPLQWLYDVGCPFSYLFPINLHFYLTYLFPAIG